MVLKVEKTTGEKSQAGWKDVQAALKRSGGSGVDIQKHKQKNRRHKFEHLKTVLSQFELDQ